MLYYFFRIIWRDVSAVSRINCRWFESEWRSEAVGTKELYPENGVVRRSRVRAFFGGDFVTKMSPSCDKVQRRCRFRRGGTVAGRRTKQKQTPSMRIKDQDADPRQRGGDKVMSRADVAHWLGVSVGAVDAYCRAEDLPFRKVGRRVLFGGTRLRSGLAGVGETGGAGAAAPGSSWQSGVSERRPAAAAELRWQAPRTPAPPITGSPEPATLSSVSGLPPLSVKPAPCRRGASKTHTGRILAGRGDYPFSVFLCPFFADTRSHRE